MRFYFMIYKAEVLVLFAEQGNASAQRSKGGGIFKCIDAGSDNNQPARDVTKFENGFIIQNFIVVNFEGGRLGRTASGAQQNIVCCIGFDRLKMFFYFIGMLVLLASISASYIYFVFNKIILNLAILFFQNLLLIFE